eukprot:5880144-Prymnesium_polylepis.1
MMQPIGVRRFEVRRFVGTTTRKPARALTKERKSWNYNIIFIIFDALLFRARISPSHPALSSTQKQKGEH